MGLGITWAQLKEGWEPQCSELHMLHVLSVLEPTFHFIAFILLLYRILIDNIAIN